MSERWKEIPKTSGRYSVSDQGNVRANWTDVPQRNRTDRMRIDGIKQLRACVHTTGYLRLALGRGNHHYVHRLVAAAFVPNPNELPQVDHIDGNRRNNCAANLRWVTAKDNTMYGGARHGWEAQKIASAKRRIHDAKKTEYQALLEQGYSLRQIAKLFGTSHSAISSTLRR